MAAPVQPGPPLRVPPRAPAKRAAGMTDYLREAFLFRWNALSFAGGVAAAAMTPMAAGLLRFVAAAELTYLAGLISIRRFRVAIDAKVAATGRTEQAIAPAAAPSLVTMLAGLPADARARFERLHAR